jgi:hypothetical protein
VILAVESPVKVPVLANAIDTAMGEAIKNTRELKLLETYFLIQNNKLRGKNLVQFRKRPGYRNPLFSCCGDVMNCRFNEVDLLVEMTKVMGALWVGAGVRVDETADIVLHNETNVEITWKHYERLKKFQPDAAEKYVVHSMTPREYFLHKLEILKNMPVRSDGTVLVKDEYEKFLTLRICEQRRIKKQNRVFEKMHCLEHFSDWLRVIEEKCWYYRRKRKDPSLRDDEKIERFAEKKAGGRYVYDAACLSAKRGDLYDALDILDLNDFRGAKAELLCNPVGRTPLYSCFYRKKIAGENYLNKLKGQEEVLALGYFDMFRSLQLYAAFLGAGVPSHEKADIYFSTKDQQEISYEYARHLKPAACHKKAMRPYEMFGYTRDLSLISLGRLDDYQIFSHLDSGRKDALRGQDFVMDWARLVSRYAATVKNISDRAVIQKLSVQNNAQGVVR